MYLKRVLGKYWLQSVLSWTGGPTWQLAALFSTKITNSPSTIRMHNIVLFYAFFASNTAHRKLSFYFCILAQDSLLKKSQQGVADMKRFGQTLTPFKIIPRLAELGSRSAAQALSVLYTRPVNSLF